MQERDTQVGSAVLALLLLGRASGCMNVSRS